MYTDPRVVRLVNESFVPVRAHVKENAAAFKQLGERYGAQWTPTTLIVDANGQERHRIEGFLPADDFLPQLQLGAAHAAFANGDYQTAARSFDQILKEHPTNDAAAEAQYLGRRLTLQSHGRSIGAEGDRAALQRAVPEYGVGEESVRVAVSWQSSQLPVRPGNVMGC